MPDPTIQFGILKCRDLVQLYYGARLVAVPKEQLFFQHSGAPAVLILGQDPRRIKYEIILSVIAAAAVKVFISTQTQIDNANGAVYSFAGQGTQTIVRSFLTDLDSVCLPLLMSCSGNSVECFVREIILTPSPIDEGP